MNKKQKTVMWIAAILFVSAFMLLIPYMASHHQYSGSPRVAHAQIADSPFLTIFMAIIVAGVVYAFRGKNVKEMICLYHEERATPVLSKISLRMYRIFILIIIPGLPIYFIILKLIGVIDWSWWWVFSPVLLIFTPYVFLVVCFAIGYCRKWKIKHILKNIFMPQVANEDENFSKIAEQIAERHNKYGVTLTDPRTGKDLLAGMTDEQRENYRQFKIKTSRMKQEKKENGELV